MNSSAREREDADAAIPPPGVGTTGSGGPRPVAKAVGGGVAGGNRVLAAGSSTLSTHAR